MKSQLFLKTISDLEEQVLDDIFEPFDEDAKINAENLQQSIFAMEKQKKSEQDKTIPHLIEIDRIKTIQTSLFQKMPHAIKTVLAENNETKLLSEKERKEIETDFVETIKKEVEKIYGQVQECADNSGRGEKTKKNVPKKRKI
jgi:hypothetical protein